MEYKITARYNHKDERITEGKAQMTLDCQAARDAVARLNRMAWEDRHRPEPASFPSGEADRRR